MLRILFMATTVYKLSNAYSTNKPLYVVITETATPRGAKDDEFYTNIIKYAKKDNILVANGELVFTENFFMLAGKTTTRFYTRYIESIHSYELKYIDSSNIERRLASSVSLSTTSNTVMINAIWLTYDGTHFYLFRSLGLLNLNPYNPSNPIITGYYTINQYPNKLSPGTATFILGEPHSEDFTHEDWMDDLGNYIIGNAEPIDGNDPIPLPDDDKHKRDEPTGDYPDSPTDDEHNAPPSLNGTLYTVYHIGVSQLVNLSAFLWSKGFIDNLLKINSNAIENIISLHWFPLEVTNGVSKNVILGNLDSKISAYIVDENVTVDYGSITINTPSGSYLDFSPYTKFQIHVPYCGIHPLNTDEVMRGTLNLIEHINLITGAVSAFLFVTRDGKRKMLYAYSGSCTIELTITGTNYANTYLSVASGAASKALGISTTLAIGGSAAPIAAASMAVSGAVSGATDVMGAKPDIEHGGSFNGGSGYYDVAQAYLICEYPNISKPNYWYRYQGKPYNQTEKLSSLSGFFIVENINLEVSGATDTECAEIEQILKAGAIK